MRRSLPLAIAALAAATFAAAACSSRKSAPTCGSPDGCSSILVNIDTHQAHVEMIDDGVGGAYAALLGAGDSETCVQDQVCHGSIWRLGATGAVLWEHTVGYAVDAPFTLPDGGVAWRGNDGGLHVANGDGTPRWDAPLGDVHLLATPAAGGVYVLAGGNVERLDAKTGAVVWTKPFPAADPTALVALPDASAVVAGYAGTNGEFRRVAFEDGSTLYDVQLRSTLSAPRVISRWPYGPFLLAADRLSLVDWNGRESWGFDAPEGWRYVLPLGSDWIGNGPYEQRITRLRSDGTALWVVPVPAPITWLSVTPDSQLLVGRNDGTLDKLKVSDGLVLWEYGGIAGVKAPTPPRYTSKGNIVFAGANVGATSDTHLTTASPAGQELERWDAGARVSSFVVTGTDDVWLATTAGKLYFRLGASL